VAICLQSNTSYAICNFSTNWFSSCELEDITCNPEGIKVTWIDIGCDSYQLIVVDLMDCEVEEIVQSNLPTSGSGTQHFTICRGQICCDDDHMWVYAVRGLNEEGNICIVEGPNIDTTPGRRCCVCDILAPNCGDCLTPKN
jgi:hypothetical protein